MSRLSPRSLFLLSGLFMHFAGYGKAEPPNPLYQYHMNDATAVYNMTLFVIPYPKKQVQELAEYPLLAPSFATPEETAPLVLQFGKLVDIRQSVAQIPELMSANIVIPFVDRLKDDKTSFSRTKHSFVDQIIPAIVSSLVEGYRNELATFTPAHDAYGESRGIFFYQVKQTLVQPPPSPVGGPGLSVPTFDAVFTPLPGSGNPLYPQSVYEQFVNGPIFGFVVGNITLYEPLGGGNTMTGGHFAKPMEFIDVHGITATVAEIQGTFPPVDCSTFA